MRAVFSANLKHFTWMKYFFVVIALICFLPLQLQASYILLYSTNDNGAITFTGNTLGLNKASNQNQPGNSGAIGAFITTNTALQVGTYPVGTTLNYTLNNSTAVLDIPSGSTILHAELIWSGSYGFDSGITLSLVNSTSITFTTPDTVDHIIAPRVDTAQSRVNSDSDGFYVRTADVTAFVTDGGTYTVGGVPASVSASENNLNCCGWTLAVAYQNPNMFTSNLTLFTGCEASGADPAAVTGFQAPNTGSISSRMFCSALEGDVRLTGDHFLIGESASLSFPADAVSGSNNPVSNFFASQINTLLPLTTDVTSGKLVASGSSLLDTRGSFGSSNSNASTGTGVSGARQGYDITSIDISAKITNGQSQLFAQGTTDQDVYTVNALGIQIQVQAPLVQSVKEASVTNVSLNDIFTYTLTFTNIGQSDASSLSFADALPTGLTLVPGTFTVDGTPVASPDLNAGVPLGDLAVNETRVVVFNVQVTQINPPTSYVNSGIVTYSFVPFGGEDPIILESQTNEITVTANLNPPPIANPDTGTTNVNTPLNGATVLSNDMGTSITVSTYDPVSTSGGTVFMQADGTYLYTPPADFSGTDTFQYTIQDADDQMATTTVTITVLPLANNDTSSVAANTPLNELTSVLNNDEGTSLTVTSFDATSANGASIVMQTDGTYLYTPPTDFSGVDTFTYTATDSSGNDTSATVTITVLPAAADNVGSTPANTTLNGSTVFSNDVGTGLTITAYDATSTQGGSVVMNTTDGTYVYNPPAGFSGIDTFTYTVTDEAEQSSTATVIITVLPLANNDTGSTTTNTALNQLTSVLANDVGTSLTVSDYDSASLNGGTIVMQSDGTYVYTPPNNYSGPDSFNYTLIDSEGNTSTASVQITVLPLANNDSAIIPANTTLVGSSVLLNDTGSTLTVTDFDSISTQGGTVAVNVNGTYTYMPPTGFSGTDTFTYTTTDSFGNVTTATVTITVTPVAIDDVATTPENIPLNGPSVLLNDIGSGLTILTYDTVSTEGGVISMDLLTGQYVYTPPLGFTGIDTFTYTIIDSSEQIATATVTITVEPVPPPAGITATLDRCALLNKTYYRLDITWIAAPPSASVVLYRIYYLGVIVAEIPATGPLAIKVCLKNKESAQLYQISAVNSGNAESVRINMEIE